jgi:TPR repeat protein
MNAIWSNPMNWAQWVEGAKRKDFLAACYAYAVEEDLEQAAKLLSPLVKDRVPAAVMLRASFSLDEEADAQKEKAVALQDWQSSFVKSVEWAAEQGFPPAQYEVGQWYDCADHGYSRNLEKAANYFQQAAYEGHPRSMWIHGQDLVYGQHGVSLDIERGVYFVRRALAAGFSEAAVTLARWHQTGEFGLSQSQAVASRLTELARKLEEL